MIDWQVATTLLSLVAGVSGLVLAWRSYGIKARSAYVDDLDKIRLALKEENERLIAKVNDLEKRLEQAEQLIAEFEAERKPLMEKVAALEEELAEYKREVVEELERRVRELVAERQRLMEALEAERMKKGGERDA